MAMDTATVQERCQDHADAMVRGDLKRASEDLSEWCKAEAPAIMKLIPMPLDSARVTNVREDGDEHLADIVYSGGGRDVTVQSRWADIEGRPYITKMTVV